MTRVTFQVLDGVDKGRVFRELPTPVTIGREEGNTVRLNDERVSRFHAKVQLDQNDLVLTDLESTNGTKVNGHLVQIHRLRHGDFVTIGRSVLLFGSYEEIAARQAALGGSRSGLRAAGGLAAHDSPSITATAMDYASIEADPEFDVDAPVRLTEAGLFIGDREFPPLPQKLTPSQSARLAEIFDFLHRALSQTTERAQANEDGSQVTMDYATWQKILALEMLMARYQRAIAEPDAWNSPSS
jgi:hypothetical protein